MNRRVILVAHVVAVVVLLLAAVGFVFWQSPVSARTAPEQHAVGQGGDAGPTNAPDAEAGGR